MTAGLRDVLSTAPGVPDAELEFIPPACLVAALRYMRSFQTYAAPVERILKLARALADGGDPRADLSAIDWDRRRAAARRAARRGGHHAQVPGDARI